MKTWTGDLTVFDVNVEGESIRVDLVGGDRNVCGSLLYEFDDKDEGERNLAVLRRWRDNAVTVLAFAENDVVTLIDPQATIENLLAELSID